uniref:Putative secreted protein n=1 Tax=Anopheles darlingi TaxID=43151 RepID=A0A2M4DHH8_ANODA
MVVVVLVVVVVVAVLPDHTMDAKVPPSSQCYHRVPFERPCIHRACWMAEDRDHRTVSGRMVTHRSVVPATS